MQGRIRWPETISVFAVGIAVGAALGVLFAPKSGEETRDFIADTARDSLDGAVASGRRMARRAQTAVGQAKEQAEEIADAGRLAFEQTRRA
jgi:gas vesicle protein